MAALPNENMVTVLAKPLRTCVLLGVSNTIPVMFNIKTGRLPKVDVPTRAPLNLCLVLDKSGSMSGSKLKNAKEAVVKVISNLGSDDIFHFVIYDTNVAVVFENATPNTRDALIAKVNQVQAGSCTNLSGGLEQGAKLVNKHDRPGYQKRIFLFSDGLANEGVQSVSGVTQIVSRLRDQSHIKIDSFGIGDDFDTDMMKNIAECGCGEFYFINSANEITGLVSKALCGLLTIVGSDTVLKVRGKADGIVKRIYGHDSDALIKGARVGDLHQENSRKIMCDLEISPKIIGPGQEFLQYELSYTPHDAKSVEERSTLCGTVTFNATDDDKEIESNVDDCEVAVAVTIQKAADSDEQIGNLVKKGDVAGAQQAQQAQICMLETCAQNDSSGMAANLLKLSRQNEQKLKQQGASKEVKQHYGHGAYMKRRCSMEYVSKYA